MDLRSRFRSRIKRARKRGALWVRALDILRLAASAEGRGQLWTRAVHQGDVHQTTPFTAEDRYPELFDLAARPSPDARRILSFGCSTGAELVALRRRFPAAEIVGAEINPRSRRMAARRAALDRRIAVVDPDAIRGSFDLVFALAVLQREPHKIAEMEVEDLSSHYPFERFDKIVGELVDRLRHDGLLCVVNAHYPVEESSAGSQLDPVKASPVMDEPLFGRDGRRLVAPVARTLFRKRPKVSRRAGTRGGARSAARGRASSTRSPKAE
jgi:SAM-dependent methyltransferase